MDNKGKESLERLTNFKESYLDYCCRHNMTKAQLAKKLGFDGTATWYWFNKKPSASVVLRFNNLLAKENKAEETKEIEEVPSVITYDKEKVELETLRDVIDSLHDGEVVQMEDFTTTFMMVGDVICSFNGSDILSVNPTMLNDQKYFVMRDKRVTIELGKFYKSNTGEKFVAIFYNETSGKYTLQCVGRMLTVDCDKYGTEANIVKEW